MKIGAASGRRPRPGELRSQPAGGALISCLNRDQLVLMGAAACTGDGALPRAAGAATAIRRKPRERSRAPGAHL